MPEADFDSAVWGPHYWFFLHTIARAYPAKPSETMQKKYYNFYQDFPLFIPTPAVGNRFARMIDKYPVSPYLSSQDQLIRWTNFIQNKVNALLEKEQLTNVQCNEAYWQHYASDDPTPKSSVAYYLLVFAITGVALGLNARSN